MRDNRLEIGGVIITTEEQLSDCVVISFENNCFRTERKDLIKILDNAISVIGTRIKYQMDGKDPSLFVVIDGYNSSCSRIKLVWKGETLFNKAYDRLTLEGLRSILSRWE